MNRRNRGLAAILVGVLGSGFGFSGTAWASANDDELNWQVDGDTDELNQIELTAELGRLAAGQAERNRLISEQQAADDDEQPLTEPTEHVITELRPTDDDILDDVAVVAAPDLVEFNPELNESQSALFFHNPLSYMHVTSSYGSRFHPTLHYTRMHSGTDLRAPCGTSVLAAQNGLVVSARWSGTGGNTIMIDHGVNGDKNLKTRYLHLSKMLVEPGQWVKTGDEIGRSGMTGGVSTGCHLHFEVLFDDETTDPLTQLPDIPPESVPEPVSVDDGPASEAVRPDAETSVIEFSAADLSAKTGVDQGSGAEPG